MMIDTDYAFSFYPDNGAVDMWCSRVAAQAEREPINGEFTDISPVKENFGCCANTLVNRYVRFERGSEHVFWGYWQPAIKQPAPLLINLPGYGGFINLHPQLCDDGFNVLHISPMGYVWPDGLRQGQKMSDGNLPVLPNTAKGLPGGYEDWLTDCMLAVRWALSRHEVSSDRFSVYGMSQGGGTSLLLASLMRDRVNCVCADLPFLTAIPLSGLKGEAYGMLEPIYNETGHEEFWRRMGYFDTISHAHRLDMPVMLGGGGKDDVCPHKTVEMLFSRLPGTKQYTFLRDGIHTHSRESMLLFRTWMRLYA